MIYNKKLTKLSFQCHFFMLIGHFILMMWLYTSNLCIPWEKNKNQFAPTLTTSLIWIVNISKLTKINKLQCLKHIPHLVCCSFLTKAQCPVLPSFAMVPHIWTKKQVQFYTFKRQRWVLKEDCLKEKRLMKKFVGNHSEYCTVFIPLQLKHKIQQQSGDENVVKQSVTVKHALVQTSLL